MRTARSGRKSNPGVFEDLKELSGLFESKRSNLTEKDARKLAEGFHGRPSRGKIEIAEREKYFSKLFILGELEELGILQSDDIHILPIRFKPNKLIGQSIGDSNECVWVCGANKNQIEFVDGDQQLDFNTEVCRKLDIDEGELEKQYIRLGPVITITYYTDKSHLEGPKYQANGTTYEHKFAEEKNGKLPELFYDSLNDRCLLVGGSYTITDEGIRN